MWPLTDARPGHLDLRAAVLAQLAEARSAYVSLSSGGLSCGTVCPTKLFEIGSAPKAIGMDAGFFIVNPTPRAANPEPHSVLAGIAQAKP